MPVARFQMPDGRVARFEVPDGTTPEQAQAYGEQYFASQQKPADKFDFAGDNLSKVQNYDPRNAIGGSIRGAGSIGSTLIRPFESAQENSQRRTDIDQGLTALIGSDPNSTPYKTTKLGTELLGTSGIGGAAAKGLSMIPGAARALPTLLPAIQSGGMNVNGAKGLYALANRTAGGAVNGALTAGAIDPSQADEGLLLGGAAPGVLQFAGKAGNAVGSAFRARPISPVLQQTARESVDAGYVIPPNMVAPSFKSQVLESFSGKQATQQIASTRNTQTTEKLVRQALGIADDIPMTKNTLESLRKTAGKAYAEVSSLSPQAAADLEALKIARNEAQTWFKAYNRSQHPADLAKAKELRAEADNLEGLLEFHAASAGKDSLIDSLRKARKEIAKTYTVERALNDASGSVDARVLGRLYEKGAPLSDGLEKAGKFASAFPSIAKSPQQVGSPAAHNLKAMLSMAMAGGGYAGMGPAGLALAAAPFVAGPASRSIMFSKPVQKALASQPAGRGLLAESIDELSPLLHRSGAGLLTSR
jgi:hypothetical protein